MERNQWPTTQPVEFELQSTYNDWKWCRYDARSAISNYRTSLDDSRAGGNTRIHFQFNRHPALLLLSNVVGADEGVYRCRVDFGKSPTRNVHVRLDVVGNVLFSF